MLEVAALLTDFNAEQSIDLPKNRLYDTDGFESSYDGEIIEDLNIVAVNNPVVLNHRVVFRNSRISFNEGTGLIVNTPAANSQLYNLLMMHQALPGDPAPLPDDHIAIVLDEVFGVSLERIRIRGGCSGIIAQGVSGLLMRHIQGSNFYGDVDRGGFIEVYDSERVRLENFYCDNPFEYSHPEDVVLFSNTSSARISNGRLIGNNSPTGLGLVVRDSSFVQVSDVDVSYMGNGSVGAQGGLNNQFSRINVRNTHTAAQGGRAAPSNPGRAFFSIDGAGLDVDMTSFDRCTHFALADESPTVVLDGADKCDLADIVKLNIAPRAAISLHFSWETNPYDAPYLFALNGPDGTGTPYIVEAENNIGSAIGKLYAESNEENDTLVFSIVDDPFHRFVLDGDLVKLAKKVNHYQATSYPLTVKVIGNNLVELIRTFNIPVDADTSVNLNLIDFGAEEMVVGTPTLSAQTLLVNSLFGIEEFVVNGMLIDPVSITQQHAFGAESLTLPAPIIEAGVILLDSMVTGVPTLSSVTIVQNTHFIGQELEFGVYYLPSPIISQNYTPNVITGAPTVSDVNVVQNHIIIIDDLVWGVPTISDTSDLVELPSWLTHVTTGAVIITPVTVVQQHAIELTPPIIPDYSLPRPDLN